MIYFIVQDNRFVKIGYTDNLVDRMKSLQTASPKTLKVKALLDGGCKTEAELHRMFAQARARGEWFQQTREVKWFMRAVQANPDTSNIYSLYKMSQKMYLVDKAKRLGPKHRLSKGIRRHTV